MSQHSRGQVWRLFDFMICGLAMLFGGSGASACPFCDSETGRQVHAGIFNNQFWKQLVLTALPFVILFGVVALIQMDLFWTWANRSSQGGDASVKSRPRESQE